MLTVGTTRNVFLQVDIFSTAHQVEADFGVPLIIVVGSRSTLKTSSPRRQAIVLVIFDSMSTPEEANRPTASVTAPEAETATTMTTTSSGSRKRSVEDIAATAAATMDSPATAEGVNPHTATTNAGDPTTAEADAATIASSTATASTAFKVQPPPSKKMDTKPYKGLRHFSMMVCKKVEEKGTTTYNEVADELVAKVVQERRKDDPNGKYDEKNIRRRVYDALNVLMAMDIIIKDKKAITWKGLPTSASQDLEMLQREVDYRRQEVERKRQALQELLIQQVCFRNLVEHNREEGMNHRNKNGSNSNNKNDDNNYQKNDGNQNNNAEADSDHNRSSSTPNTKIPLPFIVVNTHSSAVIQCTMSRELTDVMFDFSLPFEINDDNTILKRLGMYVKYATIVFWLGVRRAPPLIGRFLICRLLLLSHQSMLL